MYSIARLYSSNSYFRVPLGRFSFKLTLPFLTFNANVYSQAVMKMIDMQMS